MTLEEQINIILDDFDQITSEQFLEIINQIKPHFKNELIAEYLEGKIQKILDIGDEVKKKKQCQALMPYLDWYLQGL
jgi:hypothetical protein